MLATLSKLDLHNSSIQRLIKWFDRKVINFNLKNQINIHQKYVKNNYNLSIQDNKKTELTVYFGFKRQ